MLGALRFRETFCQIAGGDFCEPGILGLLGLASHRSFGADIRESPARRFAVACR